MAQSRESKRKSLQAQRKVAKVGMTASMGVLFWTAMRPGRRVMGYHALAGIALAGFTIWHMMLYNGNGSSRSR